MLTDALEICRGMFTQPTTTYAGTHFSVTNAFNSPAPINGEIPIMIGGQGEKKTFRLAAQYAHELNTTSTFDDLPRKLDALQGHLDAVGRDRSDITVTPLSTMIVAATHDEAHAKLAALTASRGVELDTVLADPALNAMVLGRMVWGDQDEVVARVQELIKVGLDGFVVNLIADAERHRGHGDGRRDADQSHRLTPIECWRSSECGRADFSPFHTPIGLASSAAMQRRFSQVDVFTETPYRGNPVAVVLDGDGLADDELARIANWTNLSETTFVLPPTQLGADYRVRIFTPSRELPFAGHPTLGTCHAWLQAGGQPTADDVVVQECAAGLVRVRRAEGRLAFAAPPILRGGPADDELVASLTTAAGIDPATVVAAEWVDNGPGWIALLLDSVDAVLAASPTTEVGGYVGLVGAPPGRGGRRPRGAGLLPAERHGRGGPGDRQPQRVGRPVAARLAPPPLPLRRPPGDRPRPRRPGPRRGRRRRHGLDRRRHRHVHRRHHRGLTSAVSTDRWTRTSTGASAVRPTVPGRPLVHLGDMHLRRRIIGAVLAGASLVGVASMASSVAHAEMPTATGAETSATAPSKPIPPGPQLAALLAVFDQAMLHVTRLEAEPDGRGLEASAAVKAMYEQAYAHVIADYSSQVDVWNRWAESLAAAT